jgi:hypothetical protein
MNNRFSGWNALLIGVSVLVAIIAILLAISLFSDVPLTPQGWSQEKEIEIRQQVDLFACVRAAFAQIPQLDLSGLKGQAVPAVLFDLRLH